MTKHQLVRKKYREDHGVEIREYRKKYYTEHRDQHLAYRHKEVRSYRERYGTLCNMAQKRGLVVGISFEEFFDLVRGCILFLLWWGTTTNWAWN